MGGVGVTRRRVGGVVMRHAFAHIQLQAQPPMVARSYFYWSTYYRPINKKFRRNTNFRVISFNIFTIDVIKTICMFVWLLLFLHVYHFLNKTGPIAIFD